MGRRLGDERRDGEILERSDGTGRKNKNKKIKIKSFPIYIFVSFIFRGAPGNTNNKNLETKKSMPREEGVTRLFRENLYYNRSFFYRKER